MTMYQLNGTTDAFGLPDLAGVTDFTVAFRIAVQSFTAPTATALFSANNAPALPRVQLDWQLSDGTAPVCNAKLGSGTPPTFAPTVPSLGRLHWFTIVRTGQDVVFYLDGKQNGSIYAGTPDAITLPFPTFGAYTYNGGQSEFLTGLIDRISLWTRAWSSTEASDFTVSSDITGFDQTGLAHYLPLASDMVDTVTGASAIVYGSPTLYTGAIPDPDPLPVRVRAGWPKVWASGNTLTVLVEQVADGTAAPVSSVSGGASIRVNGGAAIALTDGLFPAGNVGNYVFYPLAPAPLITAIDEADATGCTLNGTWAAYDNSGIYAGVFLGGAVHRSTAPADTAHYAFTGLTAGSYDLFVTTAYHDPANTANASYSCNDGVNPAQVFHQDQSAAITFDEDDYLVRWKKLGTVTVAGTTLNITLANAAGTGMLVADGVRLRQVIGRVVPAGATVTFSAPAGWLTTTAGDVQASDAIPVSLATDAELMPYNPAAWAGMRLGGNINQPVTYSSARCLANILDSFGAPVGIGGDLVYDANNDPTGIGTATGVRYTCIQSPKGPIGADKHDINPLPDGDYVVRWSGTGGNPRITDTGSIRGMTVGAVVLLPDDATTGKHVATIRVTRDPHVPYHSNLAYLDFDGLVSSAELLAPGTPTDWTHRSAKVYYDRYHNSGYGAMRWLDCVANGPGVVNFADTPNPDQKGIYSYRRYQSATVAAIEPIDTSDSAVLALYPQDNNRSYLKVTTTTPHGFETGNQVTFHLTNNDPVDTTGNVTRTNSYYGVLVHKVSDTVFVGQTFSEISQNPAPNSGLPITLTAPFNFGSGTVDCTFGSDLLAYRTIFDLCEEWGIDPWIQLPTAASDDFATQVGTMAAARLSAGRKWRFEYTNEPWNPGFLQYNLLKMLAWQAGLGAVPAFYYARRSSQLAALARAAWVAAGRDAADFIHVMGSQEVGNGFTGQICSQCQNDGTSFDELALGTYLDDQPRFTGELNYGDTTVRDAAYDRLDVDGLIELTAVNQLFSPYGALYASHQEKLGAFPNVKTVSYEGSYDRFCTYGVRYEWRYARTIAVSNHPRTRLLQLARYQTEDQTGYKLVCNYLEDGINMIDKATTWVSHPNTLQLDGKGDGSDGLNDNRVNLWDFDRVVSVRGQANREYAALVLAPPPAATTYTLATSVTGTVGVAQPVTVTLDYPAAAGLTVNLASAGGTFDDATVEVASGQAGPFTRQFTPTASGIVTIIGGNDAGLTDPAPASVTVSPSPAPSPTPSHGRDRTNPRPARRRLDFPLPGRGKAGGKSGTASRAVGASADDGSPTARPGAASRVDTVPGKL